MSRPDDYHDLYDDWQDDPNAKSPSPNVLKGQIRKFLEKTGMKIGDFQKILGVNANSYNKFMNGKYKDQWSATANGTYGSAAYFFWREKKLGKKNIANTLSTPRPTKIALPDLTDVVVEDENMYLTPQEVRKELTNICKVYQVTQAQLATLCGAPNGNAMSRFMSAGGEFGGKDQDFYYLAANFVEKLRIKSNKPKSKKRKALEQESMERPGKQPFLGLDPNGKYYAPAGATMSKDEMGRNIIVCP